jgi:hypothetical protein
MRACQAPAALAELQAEQAVTRLNHERSPPLAAARHGRWSGGSLPSAVLTGVVVAPENLAP